ncbi:MAG: cellulose biosynthesis cyclic di-GMP-binding regulatory protein BcsB, partial [Chloroflexota bacterium]|nr:cellulose biosynthesis cyclic di-GMP-binding regulatory protein BcsB [Chloroflexota bacterium]
MSPAVRLGLLGATVASALAVAAPAHGASAVERRDVRVLPLARAGAADLLMTGGAPRTRIVIAVPHGWERAGLRAELKWRASPLLASRSLLRVDVDGVPRATARIGAGGGRLIVDAPVHPVTGHRMVVDISGVLATVDDPCPPPDAPGAYVRLDAGSLLIVSGTRSSRPPALGSVPGLLVERVGDVVPPLSIGLPPR